MRRRRPEQLPALMATNAASGTLPDVVLHPADLGPWWAAQGLLDAAAAQDVVDRLGAGTFSRRALDLVTVGESATAVPSDGWGLVLVYRMDLFEAADLEAPATFADVAAAVELHDPRNDFFGAGLNASVLPTCDECEDEPAFLAGVSGIVPALRGPGGTPAQYGQISSLGIGNTGAYSDGWKALPIGGAGPAALADAYPAAVLDALVDGTASFDRWGWAEGSAELAASLAVPEAVGRVLDGDDVEDAIDDLGAAVEAARERVGEE